MEKPKEENNVKVWAYFAPDGYCQVRSISDDKKTAREMIKSIFDFDFVTYKDYEAKGYVLKRIELTIKLI